MCIEYSHNYFNRQVNYFIKVITKGLQSFLMPKLHLIEQCVFLDQVNLDGPCPSLVLHTQMISHTGKIFSLGLKSPAPFAVVTHELGSLGLKKTKIDLNCKKITQNLGPIVASYVSTQEQYVS